MVVYISKISKGIISEGMRFVYLSENENFINTWCVELEFHFKISKVSIKRDFEMRNIRLN